MMISVWGHNLPALAGREGTVAQCRVRLVLVTPYQMPEPSMTGYGHLLIVPTSVAIDR
jgi:hypothetical protein